MYNNIEKEIIINSSTNEIRVALIENKKLVEMYIERPDNERTIGNIYCGYIDNVVPGINSIFVNIGEKFNGFSHLQDFHSGLIPNKFITGKYQFSDINNEISALPITQDNQNGKLELHSGDKVLVQAVKEQIANKGPRVVSKITVPGRYLVLIPNESGVKISKKISNTSERKRLKKLISNLLPDDFAVIVRTAAEYKDEESLTKDFINTHNIWKNVIKNFKKAESTQILYKDYDTAASIVRDLFNDSVIKLRIDSKELYERIKEYINDVSPELLDRVEYYTENEPIFDKYYNISKDYYISLSREVFLKRGGSIVLDHTEALVAIDVNSKRFMRKKSHEANSFAINLSAAKEIAIQLRLRDLGGIIVIDFIDMEEKSNRDKIYNELKHATSFDKAKITIEPIGRFGLIEMTRQRLKPSIVQTIFERCPSCQGKGIIKSKESVAIQLDRWLKNYKMNAKNNNVVIKAGEGLFDYLSDPSKDIIYTFRIKHWLSIDLIKDPTLSTNAFACFYTDTDQNITREFMT